MYVYVIILIGEDGNFNLGRKGGRAGGREGGRKGNMYVCVSVCARAYEGIRVEGLGFRVEGLNPIPGVGNIYM